MLRVRLCDPLGPRWLFTLGPTLAIVLIALPPVAPLPGMDASLRIAASLFGVALLFARQLVRFRPRARDASVCVEAGAIEIRDAGILNQRVRSSEVIAASTARKGAGATLAIVRRGVSERPLLLDFANDSDLEAVRRALGLGHLGFGQVAWPTPARGTPLRGSGVLAFAWLMIALAAAGDAPVLSLALALVILPATVIAVLVSCLSDPRSPRVALTPEGVVTDFVVSGTLPYGNVVGAGVRADGVVLATHAGSVEIPMHKSMAEEREHLAAQVLSAAARARGEGPAPPPLPASLARLAPRGESEREWLARVDAAAANIGAADAYRGADLNPKDLWSALENPDAPTRVRAAAARVLARVAPEEARTRVGQVVASDRNAYTRACIRVALEDDIETAAQELEELARRYA
jgi:hypothetical protein